MTSTIVTSFCIASSILTIAIYGATTILTLVDILN